MRPWEFQRVNTVLVSLADDTAGANVSVRFVGSSQYRDEILPEANVKYLFKTVAYERLVTKKIKSIQI